MTIADFQGNAAEVLSQNEVERLLHQVQEQESSTLVIAGEGHKERYKQEHIQPYDFRQPAFLAASELRKLRLRHEEFCRSLAARLSIYLRLEFSLQMSKLQTISHRQFTEGLGNPTHLTLFKAEPLRGIGLLDIPPRLGLAIVDRLLGGTAQSRNDSRDLTEIETALLDQGVQIMLNEWCNQWQPFQDLRPTLIGHENNGRFLQTAPHDTVMLCLSLEARVGDCLEEIQFAFPHYMIEPIVKYLATLGAAEKEVHAHAATAQVRWNSDLNDVPVSITAEWDGLQLSARELATLQLGDLIMLEPQMSESVRVRLASAPKFSGLLGTRAGKWAVEINEHLKQ